MLRYPRSFLLAFPIFVGTIVLGVVFGANEARAEPGTFRLSCGQAVKYGVFDPIVFPGESDVGHHHTFYGSEAIAPNYTIGGLRNSETDCEDETDTSSYWIPTVYIEGRRTNPSSTFYYTARNDDKSLEGMVEWPLGLRIIAGDKDKTRPSDDPVYWGCSNESSQPKEPDVPTCTDGHLQAHVIFPDCWDGYRLDSRDHKSHMAYSSRDNDGIYRCPASHPVNLPFLIARFAWPGTTPDANDVTIASGPTTGFHSDFINAWEPRRLAFLTQHCIIEGNECESITSNHPATPPDYRAPDRDNPPPDEPPPDDSFVDIDDTVFAEDIEWITDAGITFGCNPPENTLYCPNDDVTRGEMAAFLNRALRLPAPTQSPGFTDISNTVFASDIERLAQAGITTGCNPPQNTRYCPHDDVTRGEMAAFLSRSLED